MRRKIFRLPFPKDPPRNSFTENIISDLASQLAADTGIYLRPEVIQKVLAALPALAAMLGGEKAK